MKITGGGKIQMNQDAFLDELRRTVDWRFVVEKLREKYNISVRDEVDYIKGDLVVHDNAVAYQLDFDVKVRLSMICDQSGHCLKIMNTGSGDTDKPSSGHGEEDRNDARRDALRREQADLAGGLADMMAQINKP